MSSSQIFSLVFGMTYLSVGLLGMVFLGGEREIFGLFGVDIWHNIAHALIGGAFLYGSRSIDLSRRMCLILGGLFGVLALLGFANILDEGTILHVNSGDDFLHLATAVLALYFGFTGADAPPRTL
ncbi:MAG TPA: DUF4383 domain-containing protein [Actinomycetota bacterium]|nr:DUF4383 domain-containing protein [Actinomycetota bacterium]